MRPSLSRDVDAWHDKRPCNQSLGREEGGCGGGKEDNGSRLMPKNSHGENITHNVVPLRGIGSGGVPAASVRRLDWHDRKRVHDIADRYHPDLIIGLDLIYHPAEVTPLLQTLRVLFRVKTGGKEQREPLLILPLLPSIERESLGKSCARLAMVTDNNGWLVGCDGWLGARYRWMS